MGKERENELERARYRRNLERERTLKRERYRRMSAEARARKVERARLRYHERRATGWKANTVRKYGLSRAQFGAMVAFQNSRCLVCHERAPLSVDHCHRTGKVRALLCCRCNLMLPESATPELLRRLADYLAFYDRL